MKQKLKKIGITLGFVFLYAGYAFVLFFNMVVPHPQHILTGSFLAIALPTLLCFQIWYIYRLEKELDVKNEAIRRLLDSLKK